MAWNFFGCVCGRFASIDTFSYLSWPKTIRCQCSRKLTVFTRDTAHHKWYDYMRAEASYENADGP